MNHQGLSDNSGPEEPQTRSRIAAVREYLPPTIIGAVIGFCWAIVAVYTKDSGRSFYLTNSGSPPIWVNKITWQVTTYDGGGFKRMEFRKREEVNRNEVRRKLSTVRKPEARKYLLDLKW